MSVTVSGSGPSSRRLPARTNGTLFRTHSYMMPLVSRPASTAPLNAAVVIDGIDGAHVIAMAVLFLPPVGEANAERGAEQRGLDVVHAERIAAEQRMDIAVRDQLRQGRRAAGVNHHRSGDDDDFLTGLLRRPG